MQAHKSDLRYLLVFLCLLTSACASRTPISEVTLDGSQAVRVPFLTNRDLENNRDGEQYFGNGRGTLGAGSCSVYLEAPEKLRGKARVLAVNQEADAALPVAADDRLVLYVHGYNNDIKDVLVAAGEMERRFVQVVGCALHVGAVVNECLKEGACSTVFT